MNIYEYFDKEVDKIFEHSPSILLEKLLGENSKIMALDVIKLFVSLQEKWQYYKKHNIQFSIIIDEDKKGNKEEKIYSYNFGNDIREILNTALYKAIIYVIDIDGNIINKQFKQQSVTFEKTCTASFETNSVGFFLGINGIDAIIRGKVYKAENHLDSYNDMMYSTLLSITEYRKLLNKFIDNEVMYDPLSRYFASKNTLQTKLHYLLDKHHKLLHSKPEKSFQNDLEFFLKQNCIDEVLTEVHNKSNDRYDIWVSTSDNLLYVFEIKWLGKSITPDGGIFSAYNDCERAISGAYQLKNYVDDAEKYSYILADTKIHCGVLVIFDCRDEMSDPIYPEEFEKYYQIDLKQHFKIEKEKVSSSQIYKQLIKIKN